MTCILLVVAVILIIFSFILREAWFTGVTVIFIICFAIVWTLVSLIDLGRPRESMFDAGAYTRCFKKVEKCANGSFKFIREKWDTLRQ